MQTRRQLSSLINETDVALIKNKQLLAEYQEPLIKFAREHRSLVFSLLSSTIVIAGIATKKYGFPIHHSQRLKRYSKWLWRTFSTFI